MIADHHNGFIQNCSKKLRKNFLENNVSNEKATDHRESELATKWPRSSHANKVFTTGSFR